MLGAKKAGMSKVEIRRECRKYAEKYIDLQRKGFQRLGVFGEWDRPYLTMDFSYEADIVRAFGEFVDKGLVYKGLKPVHWCFSCKTALAEAEVEYEDHVSPSVYVAFPLGTQLSDLEPALAEGNWSVVIWTTTPWTLPANLAIAFHPDIEYAAVRVGDRGYVVAADLLGAVAAKVGWKDPEIVARFRGSRLEGRKARHPLVDRESLLVLGEYVTLDQGTGCVHTAPGHGYDDYVTGVKYGLEILCPVDDEGRFEENVEFFTLTYETPVAVSHHLAFTRIAPLLWVRAGSRGRRIDKTPSVGWAVADVYGLLTDLDQATLFLKAVRNANDLRIAYIVTDDERRFQALARRLPEGVEPVRLYESYLTNFAFANVCEE